MVNKNTGSQIDILAAEQFPLEYPDGAPKLLPYLKLFPYTRRAEAKRKLTALTTVEDRLKAMVAVMQDVDPADVSATTMQAKLEAAADLDDLQQAIYDFLIVVAEDPVVFRTWVESAEDDNALSMLWATYMRKTQLGEASSSAN